jgi:hypothetical protein
MRIQMKKIITILSIISLCAIITNCTTASAKSGSGVVKHEIKYSNKGSRSEGRSGYLIVNDFTLPDCFNKVAAEGKVYSFKTKSTTWGDDGYFPVEGESVESVFPAVNKKISDSDLLQGWSEIPGRYVNIPSHWILVKWSNGSAALSPDKIDAFIKVKTLNLIPRNSMFNEKMMKLK